MSDDKGLERIKADKPAGMSDPALARWIRGHWHTKKIGKIELIHATQSGKDRVCVWEKDKLSGKEPDQLIQDIYTEAQEDAVNFRGLQRYAVFFFEEGSQTPNRKVFTIRGSDEFEGDDDMEGSEPANAKGHLAQMMRHNEAYARIAMGGFRDSQNVMKDIIQTQSAQIKEFQSMHFKVMDMYGLLKDKSFEQEIERKEKTSMMNMKEQFVGMFMSQAPTLLNMFASKMSSNDEKQQKDTELKLLMMQYAQSLTPEQMQSMMTQIGLTQPQQVLWMQIYNNLRDEYLASPEGQAAIKKQQEAEAAAAAAEAEAKAHVDQEIANAAAKAEEAKKVPDLDGKPHDAEGPIITPAPSEPGPQISDIRPQSGKEGPADPATETVIEGEIVDPEALINGEFDEEPHDG